MSSCRLLKSSTSMLGRHSTVSLQLPQQFCVQTVSGHRGLHQWTSITALATKLANLDLNKDLNLLEVSKEGQVVHSNGQSVGLNRFLIGAKRHGGTPKGTKSRPRYKWDWRKLDELVGKSGVDWEDMKNRYGGSTKHYKKVRIAAHIGLGVNFDYFLVDFFRSGPTSVGSYYEERVLEVRKDPNRTPYIALCAGTKGKRWLLATDGLEAGQIIKTSSHVPKVLITGKPGDAHAVGALAIDTKICCIELYPGAGATMNISAGGYATIMRHHDGMVIIRESSKLKREFALKPECMVTVGQMSRPGYKKEEWGSPNMHKRFGFRQGSGFPQKKDGYSGRKGHPPQPPREFDKPKELPLEMYRVTLYTDHFQSNFGTAATNNRFRLSSSWAMSEDCHSDFDHLLPEDEKPY